MMSVLIFQTTINFLTWSLPTLPRIHGVQSDGRERLGATGRSKTETIESNAGVTSVFVNGESLELEQKGRESVSVEKTEIDMCSTPVPAASLNGNDSQGNWTLLLCFVL